MPDHVTTEEAKLAQLREQIDQSHPEKPIKIRIGQLKALVGPTPLGPLAQVLEAHGTADRLPVYPTAQALRDAIKAASAPATKPSPAKP